MQDFHRGHPPKNTLSPLRNSLDLNLSGTTPEQEAVFMQGFDSDLSPSPSTQFSDTENQTAHGMPQAVVSYNTTMDRAKTPGERARENLLLNDPQARVLSPSLVECKQCNKKIKLSSKSAFDTFHWRNHRARCLKTIKKKVKATLHSRQPISAPRKAATSSRAPAEPLPRKSNTPPLIDISDSEEERRSEQSPEAQSPPNTLLSSPYSIQSPLDIRHSDAILDDYILRSHPECFQRTRPLPDHWQSWSWSQLKEPHFLTPAYDGEDDQDDNEVDDSISQYSSLADVDKRAQDAAHALSMLSRSH